MIINPLMQGKGGGGSRVSKFQIAIIEVGEYTRFSIPISSGQDTIEIKLIKAGSGSIIAPSIWYFNENGGMYKSVIEEWTYGLEKTTISALMQKHGVTELPAYLLFLERGYVGRVLEFTYTRK